MLPKNIKLLAHKIGSPHIYVPILFVIGLFFLPILISSSFYQNIIILILLNATLATAWNILGGFTGQISLGHGAFFGIGAYTSTLLFLKSSIPPLIGIFGGILLSIILAFIIGFTCFKLRGPFFILATIAIGEVFFVTATVWRSVTRGTFGLFIPMKPGLMNLLFKDRSNYFYLILLFAVIVIGSTIWISRSKLGYRLRCVREDEDAAEAIGINTTTTKIIALCISAAITAACGTFLAQYFLYIDPGFVFSIDVSIQTALVAIIGGMGSPLGPAVGSIILTPIQEFLRSLLGGAYQGLYGIVYGAALIVIVIFLPEGIIKWVTKVYKRLLDLCPVFFHGNKKPEEKPFFMPGAIEAIDSSIGGYSTDEVILEASNVWKHFGGLTAVKNFSIKIKPGEIVGLIGPNGSGKTTVFNLITGFHLLSEGDFYFAGRKMPRRRKPHVAAQLGISRTFQLVKPFERLSVLENITAAALLKIEDLKEARAKSLKILKDVGLFDQQHRLARELNLGDRKRIEIARAMAIHPKLLLLDEVMSGLNRNEMEEMLLLIQRIRKTGITILMVEHMMDAIMKVSDRIIVLHHGEKIAEGFPSEVTKNQQVIQVYLGRRYEARRNTRKGVGGK